MFKTSRRKVLFLAFLVALMGFSSIANAGPIKDEWKKVKRQFETATGKKKPGKKVMGVFRQSSGIEKAIADIEKAKTRKDCKTAIGKFVTAKTSYVKLLKENQVESKDQNYKTEIDKMILELGNIEQMAAEKMMSMPES